MASSTLPAPSNKSLSKIKNKIKRNELHLRQKKVNEKAKRDERFRRKREESRNPRLREDRLARNVPVTLEKKRVWDEVDDGDEENFLGASVDVERLKRQKLEDEQNGAVEPLEEASAGAEQDAEPRDDDADSMLDEDEDPDAQPKEPVDEDDGFGVTIPQKRASSPAVSTTSTNLTITPDLLKSKFPTLFEPPPEPKILITTSINSTLHDQAYILTEFFPNSTYIPRSAHRYGHKYSVREISKFAANRGYTTVLVLMEDQKRPCGLDVVHLPHGPMFHFSISNWIEGKKLPGHGRPTNHYPELILNNFRTPLGLLSAHLFRTMFPPQPEVEGRQAVTLHNQRDYIFVRRHRYVFRDKRPTEKSVDGSDGNPMKGVEEVRTGLQELGPRFTLKLRRVDKGIQRASGQEWQWKAGREKAKTRFQL